MSAPPRKKPSSPFDPYWTKQQQTQQMDLISGATQNAYAQRKRLLRETSLQSRCDALIDAGYRETLSFKTEQRAGVMRFARIQSNGDVLYRGLRCVFREL